MAPPPNTLTILLAALLLTVAVPQGTVAQNCGCAPNDCCSQYGYCGQGPQYCGTGCKGGPCYSSNSQVSVASIVTPEFFNRIINQARDDCVGKRFYTREAFLSALNSFQDFGKLGSQEASKREIAAFFAQVTHESGFFCYTEEQNKGNSYCTPSSAYPCAPGKSYYGRGPIQLTGNENYGKAGRALNLDLLKNPEMVATDAVVSFKTALWYWMVAVRPVVNQGFGATTRAINGPLECDGRQPALVQARANYYTQYCQQLGVAPGGNLLC